MRGLAATTQHSPMPWLLFLLILSGNILAQTDEQTRDILRQIDDLWRGASSYAVSQMTVKTHHYTRSLKMQGWSLGKEKTLIKIIESLREKGTITLKSEDNIYTYLPKTDRTIRLTSGMMMGSWMGSHLTHDDLVKESRFEQDYDTRISFEGLRDGQKILEFTLIPLPEAAVIWGKVTLTVTAEDYLPLNQLYYDEDLQLARSFVFSDIKRLSGKNRPAVMRVIPADKPDEYTEFVYETLELDIPLPTTFFSLSQLKRR